MLPNAYCLGKSHPWTSVATQSSKRSEACAAEYGHVSMTRACRDDGACGMKMRLVSRFAIPPPLRRYAAFLQVENLSLPETSRPIDTKTTSGGSEDGNCWFLIKSRQSQQLLQSLLSSHNGSLEHTAGSVSGTVRDETGVGTLMDAQVESHVILHMN